jgi:diguanylate cyclase (GGDEF)-like protein
MDMDGLKTINDELGHAEGDLALRRLAEVLLRSFRQADLVARLGGDEFVALAPDAAEVGRISDRIQQNLSEIQIGEARLPIAVSIGVTWIEPGQELKIEEALADADREMYLRKRERRGSKPPKGPPVEVV